MERSLGVIVPGGTGPKRATANQQDPTKPVWAHSYRVQHYQNGNVGRGYVGSSSMDPSTGVDVFGFLPEIATSQPWPAYQSPAVHGMQNPINMAGVYIDSDDPTDEFLVTLIQV
jgi:hypothetical protein